MQRVSTILSFFGILRTHDKELDAQNDWVLGHTNKIRMLEGFSYETLPMKLKLQLKRATFGVEILRGYGSDARAELFNRLHLGKVSLNLH